MNEGSKITFSLPRAIKGLSPLCRPEGGQTVLVIVAPVSYSDVEISLGGDTAVIAEVRLAAYSSSEALD